MKSYKLAKINKLQISDKKQLCIVDDPITLLFKTFGQRIPFHINVGRTRIDQYAPEICFVVILEFPGQISNLVSKTLSKPCLFSDYTVTKNVTVQSSTTELLSCSRYFYRTRKNWGETSPSKGRSSKMDSWVMGTSSLVLNIHLFIKTHVMTTMVIAVFCALIFKREACLFVTSVTACQQVAK